MVKWRLLWLLCSCCIFLSSFWATVTSNGSPCAMEPLSFLSVTLVYCGPTVGWIKVPLGAEVDLGPGDVVLHGNPAPPPAKRSPISATAELLFVSTNMVVRLKILCRSSTDICVSMVTLYRWWNDLCQYQVITGRRSLTLTLMAHATSELPACLKVSQTAVNSAAILILRFICKTLAMQTAWVLTSFSFYRNLSLFTRSLTYR